MYQSVNYICTGVLTFGDFPLIYGKRKKKLALTCSNFSVIKELKCSRRVFELKNSVLFNYNSNTRREHGCEYNKIKMLPTGFEPVSLAFSRQGWPREAKMIDRATLREHNCKRKRAIMRLSGGYAATVGQICECYTFDLSICAT